MSSTRPTHPGEFITKVYMKPLGISTAQLAENLGISLPAVSKLLTGELELSPEIALRLSAVLGSSAYFWLSMQTHYSLWQAEQTLDMSSIGQTLPYCHSLYIPIRVQILELLDETAISLDDMCKRLHVSQDKISFHLQVLEVADLVTIHQTCGQAIYSLNIAQMNRLTKDFPDYSTVIQALGMSTSTAIST